MQFNQLKRREFMALVGGAATAWPLAARGQNPAQKSHEFFVARSQHRGSGHLPRR